MLKKIKTLIVSLAVLMPLALPVTVLAQAQSSNGTGPDIGRGLCQGSDLQFGSNGGCGTGSGESAEEKLNILIEDIVNIISVVVAIVAVIMIIVGGFKYITSGGDSGNVTGAKNTILYAIIGLVVVALAQFIVKFVLTKATGLTA